MKSHSRVLIGVLKREMRHPRTGAEIGVWNGGNSRSLLERFGELHLLMVDLYRPYQDFEEEEVQDTRLGKKSKKEVYEAMKTAVDSTQCRSDRRVVMVGDSVECSMIVSDHCLDFVFIDGCHSYNYVRRDLIAWWNKVREGGIISGHDYNGKGDRTGVFGVKRAVDGFMKKKKKEVHVENCLIWWVKK